MKKDQKKRLRPQCTIVHVAVTTDGPVPMKVVREWVEDSLAQVPSPMSDGTLVINWRVKRDADVQKPRG